MKNSRRMKGILVHKGGPGSGHHGHAGRPGKRGGSLPGRRINLISNAAREKLDVAENYESDVTNMVTELASEYGGHTVWLEHRLKTQESLMRKIDADMKEKNIGSEEAADAINDALRYTMMFDDPKDFVDDVTGVQKELASQGWTKWDTKWKNFFRPGDPYDGYNTVLVNSAGFRFELQFHTDESIIIKEQVHALYSKFRTLSEHDPERAKLAAEMSDAWNDYERPTNWEKLQGIIP